MTPDGGGEEPLLPTTTTTTPTWPAAAGRAQQQQQQQQQQQGGGGATGRRRRRVRWLGPWEGQQAGAVLLLCFQVLVVMGGLVLGTAYLWRSLRDRAARPAYPPEAYEQQQGQAGGASSGGGGGGGGGGGRGGGRGGGPVGRAWVVETLPVGGMEGLVPVPGSLATWEALLGLVEGAQACIQLSAMYWALNASASSSSLSPEQLAGLGSERGERLLAALHAAAARGVAIHVLMDNATITGDPGELQALQAAYPEQVEVRTWGAGQWFGGCGVMHLKLWVVDGRHAYLGSANLDWLSLSQVKEVGLLLRDCPGLVADLQALWHDWWAWAKLPPPPPTTAAAAGGSSSPSWVCGVWSPELQVELTRPCWSPLLPPAPGCPRCASPLPPPSHGPASSLSDPLTTTLNGDEARLAVTGSPVEVLTGGRSWDLDGLLSTIRGARHSLDVAVMDWLPASLYPLPQPQQQPGQEAVSVWWPVLQDAVLAGLVAKPGLRVRLLVSRWAHSDPRMLPALKAWLQQAQALLAPASSSSSQRLSIKVFEVPGWDGGGGGQQQYPAYSRVSHGKLVLSDEARFNVGTSNMAWEYFSCTAGASINGQHAGLTGALQQLFDRDWTSQYATDLLLLQGLLPTTT